MSLGAEQREFTIKIAELIMWAYEQGYQISLGDAYRDKRVHGDYGVKVGYGHPRSFHKKRLAIDLNLFKANAQNQMVYLTDGESHRPLGEKWESMGGTWGGRFNDSNHYSWGEKR